MPVLSCPKSTTACIAINDADAATDTQLWRTLFTDEIDLMLKHVNDQLSTLSPQHVVSRALFDLRHLTIQYDTDTCIVQFVSF